MLIGVTRETFPGERRVALVPGLLPGLAKAGLNCIVESGAGELAGFPDSAYVEKGAKLAASRAEVFAEAEIVVQVRCFGANLAEGKGDLALCRKGQILIGFSEPLSEPDAAQQLAARGVTAFAMELVPRTTRAQAMDALSSQANIAGYKAVLLAAEQLPKMFPMMMTAAGTITPASLLVMGAGVAGLQAIATARRLGAVVSAYDVRPVVKEQVESLGARFVEVPLETQGAQDSGGYAKDLGEEFNRRQRELLSQTVAASDVVITTALIPGRPAPLLLTPEMVQGMRPGSVIVDLAAERGGNCSLTRPGEPVRTHGVLILGPLNLASTVAYHASEMYGKNVASFLQNLYKKNKLRLDEEDDILQATLISRDGLVVNPRAQSAPGA